MNTKKQGRQERAKLRLESQLSSGVKSVETGIIELTPGDKTRIKNEISALKGKLSGEKKQKVDDKGKWRSYICV